MNNGTVWQRLVQTGSQAGFIHIQACNAYLIPAIIHFLPEARYLHGQRVNGLGPRFYTEAEAAAKSL